MANLADLVIQVVTSGIEDVQAGFTSMGEALSDNFGKIAATGVAAGAAAEGFARSQSESNATLRSAAVITGETEESLRSMVDGMVNYTFSAHDAARGMDRLIQSGIETRSEFETILPVMDTFGDATGTDMVKAIDIFDKTLSALGIPLTEVEEHLDSMTFLTERTTVPMMNLGQLMRREAPAIRELGLSFDDVVVAMAALEEEGTRGPRAVMAFQTAIKEAEGSNFNFWGSLNASSDALLNQRQRLAESAGMTTGLAEANTSAMTAMERMSQNMDNLMFKYGGLADAAGAVALPLLALGPISTAVSGFFKLIGGASLTASKTAVAAALTKIAIWAKMATAAVISFTITYGAILLPIAAIALVIAAVAGLVYLVVKYWDEIVAFTKAFAANFANFIMGGVDKVVGFFSELGPRIWAFVSGIPKMMLDIGGRIIQYLIDGIMAGIRNLGRAMGNVAQTIRDFLPFSPAREGPLSGRGSPLLAGRRVADMLSSGLGERLNRVRRESGRLAEAASVADLAAELPSRVRSADLRGNSPTLEIRSDGGRVGDMLVEILRGQIRATGGGNVQAVLGQ